MKEEREMHASTRLCISKPYLRYIPICDIAEGMAQKTAEASSKKGRNLQISHEHRFITKNGMTDC
jgi:hypothetical protein